MNKENASKLWKVIQEAGDYLVGWWINYNAVFNSSRNFQLFFLNIKNTY